MRCRPGAEQLSAAALPTTLDVNSISVLGARCRAQCCVPSRVRPIRRRL